MPTLSQSFEYTKSRVMNTLCLLHCVDMCRHFTRGDIVSSAMFYVKLLVGRLTRRSVVVCLLSIIIIFNNS